MEPRLTLRQGQRLVMNPALQQAIQILQLSTLELQQWVQKELLDNPLLEESPEPTSEDPVSEPEPEASSEDVPEPPLVDALVRDELPFDVSLMGDHGPHERSLVAEEEREEQPIENTLRTVGSLAEHLEQQLRLATEDPERLAVGQAIIGNIDDDGYLRVDVGDIAVGCASTTALVEEVLALVQRFDPPGVAARSVQECLLLQLRAMPEPDPVAVAMVEEHFDLLARRRYGDLARVLGVPLDRVTVALETVLRLEPKPGRRFGPLESRYVAPDVTIQKVGSDYVVLLNEDSIPRLRINAFYRSLLRQPGEEARQYVEQKMRSALWLIRSVQQRQRTIRRVTESIFRFQRDFLERGVAHVRPLALHDVSGDVGVHESTVSRVTSNKYVDTPHGLFELRFFFQSGIAAEDGHKVSAVSVRKMIQDCVGTEDPAKPLSDVEIATYLRARGLRIARRTVAKYRLQLGISPSQRRHPELRSAEPMPRSA